MHFISSNLLYDFSNDKYIENQYVECSRLQWIRSCLKGIKRKKHKIKGDWGEPTKNPPMLKLIFSYNSRLPTFEERWQNLLSFEMDESLYNEPWSGYLIGNFLKQHGSYKVQT